MSNSTSTYQAAVLAATGSAFSPNKAPLARRKREAVFTINCPGGNATGDYFDLGSLQLPGCSVKPEGVRLRFGGTFGSNAIDVKAQLKKVDSSGANAVALTTASAEIVTSGGALPAAAVSLAAPDGTALVPLAVGDMLRLYVTNGNGTPTFALPSGLIIYVEVPYDVE
jgi:hypothetical protein